MAGISNAVAQNRIAAAVGYQLTYGNFNETSPNLPQRIAILGEANTANQSGLSTTPVQITSASQVATLYGAGSPIHAVARILFPLTGGGTNAPVYVYPQVAAVGSVAKVMTITVTGTATAAGTHYVVVAGRNNVDGVFYTVNVASSDTATAIATKVSDAINAVTGSPFSASSSGAVVTLTAKWTGLTSNGLTLSMDTTLASSIGVSYAVATTTAGSGTPAVTSSLNLFQSDWNTLVINTYGTVTATMGELETYNGMPSLTNPTGRYEPLVYKPFRAITGSVADDPSSITSQRSSQCTITIAPAPLSPGQAYEAAANMAVIVGNAWINDPSQDVIDQAYPDMPMPALTSIPLMQSYTERDRIVKLGCSTVIIDGGVYKVQDFVTTYFDGTLTPAWRWCRDLNIDDNIGYGFKLIQNDNVKGKTICKDNDTVTATNIIKPKMLKALIYNYIDDLVARALIADAAFSKSSTIVQINANNPNRIDDKWNYKRTGVGRILSTTVAAGFNFTN